MDGEDVVVGVIDTGIWPEHPSFADDGSYGPSPIGAIPCEFGNTAHNANDKPFTCNNKLLGAREMLETYRAVLGAEPEEFDSARDDSGHGTHTASTAAGNAKVLASIFGKPVARIAGIAPRARVVAYKGLGEQGGFTSTSQQPSTRQSPTASMSSTSRSAAGRASRRPTRSPSCSRPMPASSWRPRPATRDLIRGPSAIRRRCLGSRPSVPAPSDASSRAS